MPRLRDGLVIKAGRAAPSVPAVPFYQSPIGKTSYRRHSRPVLALPIPIRLGLEILQLLLVRPIGSAFCLFPVFTTSTTTSSLSGGGGGGGGGGGFAKLIVDTRRSEAIRGGKQSTVS